MSRPDAVVFERVSKRYGHTAAVEAVSFQIATGTLVTLLGPSGCGKTTTLRLIAGLEQASEGRILIDGQDVTARSPAERDVSMVFQSYALFPHLNVMQNVCYGLRSSGLSKRTAADAARIKLDLVGLQGLETRLPSELSGGQQQRVALARAMVLEPKVLLFDEPLSNLDARLRRRVRDEIRALQQSLGLTVVYVTHDQSEALAISDRIIVMNQARIAQDGSPRELYESPASRFVVNFMGEASIIPVDVVTIAGDTATVRLGGTVLSLPRRGQEIGPAELAIRPHAVSLAQETKDSVGLRGVIRRKVYGGNHLEYDVVLDGVSETIFVIDTNASSPWQIGSPVRMTLSETGLSLLPAQIA
jgi:iron(III) transport system ATP-binding protein